MAIDIGPRIGIDGERQFRESIANINQQIKTMESEMRAAAAAFERSGDAEKNDAVKKRALTEQIEAQRKKLDLLREGLEKATAKYGENDTKTLKWRQAVAEATKRLAEMEGELDDVGNELDDTGKDLDEARKKTGEFGDTAKGVFAGTAILDGIKAIGGAIKDVVNYGADLVKSTAQTGDQIDKQSQKLGISRTEYQKLAYALNLYGANVDGLQAGLKTLAVRAQKGSESFTKLGLSQDFVRSASTEDLFAAVIEKLQGMAEGTERTALANDLLGRSATDLAPVLNDTQKNFNAIKDTAPIMSDATVDASVKMTDSMTSFTSTMGEIKGEIAGTIMPAIAKALDKARDSLKTGDARKAIEKAGKALGDVAAKLIELAAKILPKVVTLVSSVIKNWDKWALAIGGVVLAFKGFTIVKTLTSAINSAKTAFAGLNAVMASNPFGAVLSAIGLVIGALSAFAIVSGDASGSAGKLSEKMQEIKDASEAADESYQNALDTFRDDDSVLDANIKRTKDLFDELQVLAGATGTVNEKDRDRAEYILGELNDALGTEYEMTGDQIQQYRDMRDSIYEVIKAKQANAKLELAKGLYDDALQNKQAKVDEMLAYAKGVETAQKNLDNAINHNEMVRSETEKGHFEYATGNKTALAFSLGPLQDALYDAEQAFSQSKAVVGAYENTIATYEDASYAIATGDYEKGIRLINSLTGARFDAYEETTKLSENEKKQLKNDIAEQERIVNAYRDGYLNKTAGFTKKTLDAEQQKLDRMKRLYDNQTKVWIAKGIELAEGFANGIGQKSGSARRKVQEIVSGVIDAVDAAGGNARRAGETVSSSFGDGIYAYSNRAVENSAKMAAEVIRRMDCIDQANKMGQYIAQGLADGISSQERYVATKTDKLINDLLTGMNDRAEVHSPSRATARTGKYLMEGLAVGMGKELPAALRDVRRITGTLVDAVRLDVQPPTGAFALAGAGGRTSGMGGVIINMTVNAGNVSNISQLADIVSSRIRDTIIDVQQSRR